MKTHTARWEHRNGRRSWVLKERVKDGGAVLGRIEQTEEGWKWATSLGAGGIEDSRYAAQCAVRKAGRKGETQCSA